MFYTSASAAPVVLSDVFSQYADGSDAGNRWETDSGDWQVHANSFECMDGWKSFAIPVQSPYAKDMTIEATISLHRSTGNQWKLAGLAVVLDNSNYWHYTLCEKPDNMGNGHFCELSEMRDGNWLAQSAKGSTLTMTANDGADFDWQYDHPYRIQLKISPVGIDGVICEADGTVRCHQSYRFDNHAVTAGRPALTVDSEIASFSHFEASILQKAAAPPKPVYPNYFSLKSGLIQGRKTGYFHVEKLGGKWWIIDPSGRSFYAVGTDHVDYSAIFCEKLGYAPYHRNVEAKYGTESKWAINSVDRLKQWNFNTLGAGFSPSTYHRGLPYTAFLSLGSGFSPIGDIAPRTTWTGFPDVFDPRYPKWCEQQARMQCSSCKDDPWLLGYFLDNELEWFGKDGAQTGLVDETFKKPFDHPAKKALIEFLQARYPTIDALNQAWGIHETSWTDFAASTALPAASSALSHRDEKDFVKLIAERFFAITTAAIRRIDPHHMILGCRFAGFMPDGVMGVAGKYCDIVSVNYYGRVDLNGGYSPDMPGVMKKYYSEAKRPLMLTEWSFPALDAGLPSQHGAGQRVATQKEKAFCFGVYQRALFSLPFMVGSDYFMWVDEPAQGVSPSFPEDSNYGLVDVNDHPWADVTRVATSVNAMAQMIHSEKTARISGVILRNSAGAAILRVSNSGLIRSTFNVWISVGGVKTVKRVSISPSNHLNIPLKVKGSAFIRVRLDPEQEAVVSDMRDNTVEKILLDPHLKKPCIVVVNPTGQSLLNVPVSVPMNIAGGDWMLKSAKERGIVSQVDNLPTGKEVSMIIPNIPSNGVITLPLVHGRGDTSKFETGMDRSFTYSGALTLGHTSGSGSFFDSVKLGDTLLGSFKMLVHQTGAANQWVSPNRMESISSFSGPVKRTLIMTAENKSISADDSGDFQITCHLDIFPGEQWFGVKFLRLKNISSAPWRCVDYYFYPLSSIAGNAASDEPRSMDNVQAWYNPKAGLSYGAMFDTGKLQGFFWKDTPDGVGEHPDVYREVNLEMKPGQVLNASASDPEVFIFGSKGASENPGGSVLQRLKALTQVKTMFVR
jgi:hypothetical protein